MPDYSSSFVNMSVEFFIKLDNYNSEVVSERDKECVPLIGYLNVLAAPCGWEGGLVLL